MSDKEEPTEKDNEFSLKANITILNPKKSLPSSGSGKRSWTETSELILSTLSILKYIFWPLLILILLFVFWNPINDIVTEIPKLLSRAEEIKAGPFELGGLREEIVEYAIIEKGPTLGEKIGGLSPEAIEELIMVGYGNVRYVKVETGTFDLPNIGMIESTMITMPSDLRLLPVMDLVNRKFVEFELPIEEFESILEQLDFNQLDTTKDPERIFYYTDEPIEDPQIIEKLNKQNYHITPLGREAHEAIIDTIMSLL